MSDLSRNDFKQIARWHGYTLVIDREYDNTAKGKRKSYDFVWMSWEGAKYLYRLDWFYNLQFKYRTMKEVIGMLEAKKQEIEAER